MFIVRASPDRLCQSLHHTWLARAERYLALPRNMFYSRLLHAEDIDLDRIIRSRECQRVIQIGRSFRALDYYRSTPIECDRAGNRYGPSLIMVIM